MHLLDTDEGSFQPHGKRRPKTPSMGHAERWPKETCHDEVRNVGIDYSETVKHLRSKIGCKKKETWVHPRGAT